MSYIKNALTERQIAAARIVAEMELTGRITPDEGNPDRFFVHMKPDGHRGEHQIVVPAGRLASGRKAPIVVKFIAARAKEPEGQAYHEVRGELEPSLLQETNAAIFRALGYPVVFHHLVNIGNERLHAVVSEDLVRGGNRMLEAHNCDFSRFKNGNKLREQFNGFIADMMKLDDDHLLGHDTHHKSSDARTAFQKTFYVVYNPRKPGVGRLVMGDLDHVHFTTASQGHPVFGPIWQGLLPLVQEAIKPRLDEPRTSLRFVRNARGE